MNMNIETILSVAGILLGIVGLGSMLLAFRAIRAERARRLALEANLAALRSEFDLAAAMGVKTGQRTEHLAAGQSDLADRVDQLELRGGAQSFDQAIDAARHGIDPGTLTQQFGLSRGEADLVARLHGQKKRA